MEHRGNPSWAETGKHRGEAQASLQVHVSQVKAEWVPMTHPAVVLAVAKRMTQARIQDPPVLHQQLSWEQQPALSLHSSGGKK